MATVDNRKWLYEQLTGLGYNLGSYEDYDQAMNDRTNQDWAYDAAKSRGINMGDRNSYYQAIGLAAAPDGSVRITEPKEEESRFGILGKMGQYMGSPSAYVPMPQAEEREGLTQAEIDQRAAMRQMLQESGTIDRMEEMEKEARKNKFKAFGEALAYTPQVSSFGVSSNIYKDTEEQLADAQRAMEASAEHRQNKAMEQTLDVALDKARAGEWGGIGEDNVGNGVVDFGLGLWDSATRMSTWDFGVSDTLNGLTIAQVVKKWEEDPESLTATERNLLDAMGMATAVQEAYADQTGIGYSVGESLPQSLGFMASMRLNPASGLGKSLARKAVREYGKQSIKKNLYRIGGDFLETAIMTATTGGGRVVADALDRINGQSTYEIDPETGIVMYGGQEDQKTVGEAVVKAIGSNFIENYSEALGEYFDPLLGMSRRLAAGGLRKMNLDKWADALSDVQPSQMAASIRSLREKAKFGGVFGEIMEEEVGMALNAITVGDYTFSKEEADASNGKKQWIFDLENQLTTALSCAIMSGAMTGVETIGNVGYRREMERSVADAEKVARAAVGDEMIAQIDQASPEGMVDILRDAYMDQNLSLQQKRVLAEYATQRVRMQYYNAADAKARRQVNVTQQNAIDAYEAGRHAQLPQYYNINQEYKRSEAAINERENAEEIWDAIRLMNNMDENERQNIMRDFSEEDQELIRNWRYNAYRWQGAINHRAEQVEDLVDEYAGQVNPYVVEDEQGNRNVTTAVYGDNVVYVMAQNADGATTIVTNDGRKKMVNANELEHVQTHNADELIERFRQQTTEVVNQETEKNLSYPSEVQEPAQGVTVETLDGKQWQVAATDGENVELVGLVFDKKSGQWIPNAGDYRKMTREQFMDWQKAELDRKNANTYEQGDELVFYVNGEPISAEITGIDPDGNYYVHVSNLVDGLNKAVSDVYTAEELRKLTTPSSKVSEKTTENEGTPSEEIKQSVSEDVTNSQIGENVKKTTAEVAESVNTAQTKAAELLAELDEDEVDENIAYNTQKAIDLAEEKRKARPTMKEADGDVATYKALKAKWEAELNELQRGVLFWSNVAKEVSNARAASQTIVPEVEAEAEQPVVVQPMDMNPQPAKKAKKSRERESVSFEGFGETAMKTANDIMADKAPQNGVELAAAMLSGSNGKDKIRLIPESFRKHTGYTTKEQGKFVGLFSSNGVSMERMGELVMQADREDGTNFFDQNDANAGLNAVLEVLGQAETMADINQYITRNREEVAWREASAIQRQEDEQEQEAKDAWYIEKYGATEEELIAYNELMNEIVSEYAPTEEELQNVYSIFAEQQLEYGNEGTTESISRPTDSREGQGETVDGDNAVGEGDQYAPVETAVYAEGGAAEAVAETDAAVRADADVESNPTANYFEMAEEAQKKRKSKQKSNDKLAEKNHQQKENRSETRGVGNRPQLQDASSYESFVERVAEYLRRSYQETELSEEVANIIRDFNKGKTIIARTEQEKALLKMLRVMTNKDVDWLLSELKTKRDALADEERKAYDDAVTLVGRYRGRGEHNAVVRALTGANLREKLPLTKIDELFDKYNSDADVAELYRRVRAIAEQIGLDFWFDDNMIDAQTGGFRKEDNRVRLNAHMLYSSFVSDQEKATTIVHEILHAVADYAIETQRDIKLGLTPNVQLSKQVLSAANTILNIYEKAVKGNPLLVHEEYDYATGQMRVVPDYGTTSAREMLMEISKPEFREKLKQIEYKNRSVWQWIVDTLKSMFTRSSDVANPTAYDSMAKALDVLINEFSVDAYQKYSGLEESASRVSRGGDERTLAGLHNISEDKLKKAIKQGGLANPSIAVIDLETQGHTNFGDITLVAPSSLIDKKSGRNAGTYLADAWTPTYPAVKLRLDDKGWKKVKEYVDSVTDEPKLRADMRYGVEQYLNGYGAGYSNMQYAFLKESGVEIPIARKRNDGYISDEEFKALVGMGAQEASNGSMEAYKKFKELPQDVQNEVYIWAINHGNKAAIDKVKERIKSDERYAKLYEDEVSFSQFNSLAYDTFRRERDNGEIDVNKTFREASDYVALNGLAEQFDKWLSSKLEEAGAKEMLFAGFNNMGNAKYVPNTLENASKLMKKEGKVNAYNDTGHGSTRAVLAEKVGTLEKIRRNKGKLQDEEAVKEAYEAFKDMHWAIIDKVHDQIRKSGNEFMDVDNAAKIVNYALASKNPVRELENDGYVVDDELGEMISDFVKYNKQMPVPYFETKFERPVMLDEFYAAVIPSDTDADIVRALESAGLSIETYERGNEESRKEAVDRMSDENVRFRDGAPFFSNAERAVENIKQQKATPEQWLAMIKKDGGLKAGEDKWMGLSDWLNEQKAQGVKTLTKDEVLQFIRENQIEIEEVEYGDIENNSRFKELNDEYRELYYEYDHNGDAAFEEMVSRYGDDFDLAFSHSGDELLVEDTFGSEAAEYFLGVRSIDATRRGYTTDGLDNKQEIALVVPTIDSWNRSDIIHFGDAGEGRAVAWVRFGETTDEDGNRVLVIDEVQSKRHDEGRAKGYQSKEKGDLLAERDRLYDKMYHDGLTEEEFNRRNEINARLEELGEGRIPDAPFDKNYHELAMKRMLRYAAENGFDKVAWTKGAQQAKRYGLNKVVDTIDASNFNSDTERDVRLTYTNEQQDDLLVRMSDGVVVKGDIDGSSVEGQKLSDIIGKDAADKLLSTTDDMEIKGDGLNFGGEDRNALYDEMIPRFMNKYTKKWGTKVGEVTLPEVEEAGRTMWSVDVTPEMRESVMKGQPMFREGMGAVSDREVSYENDPIAKWQGKPRYYGKRAAAFAERERARMQKGVEEAAKILGIEVEIITDASTLKGRKAKAKGWYDINAKKVVVVIPNHVSKGDAVRTVLHEGVAHHGLRELFGDGFDAMLDNIYNNVAPELKARIDAIAERTGVDTRVATEEYLASLAEETNFKEAQKMGWWAKIWNYFVKMLNKLGMPGLILKEELTDNELRYLLWRSYQNLVDPNSFLKPLGYLDDVAKQKELKVGNYAEYTMATPRAAEMSEAESGLRYRFIGEKGAENLDRAEEATTRLDNLKVAREMEAAEKDAKTIKMATGWERGADGKWRYEVEESYNLERVKRQISEGLEESSKTWSVVYSDELGDVIKQYPDFNVDIMVWVGEEYNNEGSYSPAVEGDEQYYGRSPEIHVYAKTIDDIDRLLAHEIQHYVQEREGFASGGTTTGLRDKLSAELNNVVARAQRLRNQGKDEEADALVKKSRGLAEAVINNEEDVFGNYKKLSGEVEARNAASRLGMTMEERRTSLASETEDVAREDQIFLYDAVESAMGSRVDKRMAEVAQYFAGAELSEKQRAIVDVFGGVQNNRPIRIERADGSTRRVVMRQGREDRGGTRHSLLRHYGTSIGSYTVDELLLVEDVLANGEVTEKQRRGVTVNEYQHEIDGVRYIVVTEKKDNREEFADFYTNRSGDTRSLNTQLSARAGHTTVTSERKVSDNSSLVQEENVKSRNSEEIIAEVEREAGALGVPVRIVRSVDELPDEDTRKRAVDGQLKGYFDPRTGEVVVYEPNTDNANDAKRTVLHETVGHKGLRQLIGEERYDKAMVQLMYMLPSEVRDAVLRRAERHGWNAAIAMDEYLADQAERDVQPTWWGKVNAKIRALLRNMGFNVMLTDADVTYLIWRSRKKLMGDTAFDMATNAILKQAARKSVDYDAESDNAIRHRGVEQGKKISEAVSDYYEKYTATTNADKFWGGVKYMATHLGDGGTRALLNDLSESQFEDIRSVRVLEEAIESAEGKPLRENEMVHKSLNAKTSRDARDMDKSQTRYFQPMAKLLGKILGKKIDGRKIEIDDVERYLICKHSPENNEFLMKRAHAENRRKKIHERAKELMKGTMTEEEAIAQATSEYTLHQSDFRDDYSGLTELFPDEMVREAKITERTEELTSNGVDEDTARHKASEEFESYKPTLEDREKMAADEVARFEAAVDGLHEELWGIINGINRDTIERLFRSGLISRSLYNDLKKRHKFYVPLSGWKNDAAADIYNYAMYGFDGTPIQTVIKKAFGTKYQARNILGSMFAMNMAAITEGNQNLVKQKLYNLALNHDTGVLQIVDLWEVKDGEGDAAEWKPAPKPELRPTMSDAEMQKALTDYQNKLMEMEKDGKARKAVNSLADNFGKHTTDKEAKRHHVELLVNGRKVVIWVNGNPKLAQAINGDLKVKKELLFFDGAVDKANRFLAQVQTSLNPEFMISNFERDILSASRYNLIKYGPKYEASFMKHLAQLMPIVSETNADMRSDAWGGVGIFNLFALDRNTNNPNRKPDAQVLDMNNPLHREFVNFLNYGGKTGYVERKQAEDLQQRIKKLSKREQSIIRKYPAEVAGWAVDTIERMNEGIENATRFAAYLAARERGKSVTEAVFEAKEVSVNFNMQGSGAWGNASYRKLYNYFNVGLQALRREKNLMREAPKPYIANLAFMTSLGVIATILLTADWDGDDEDEYMGLSDFNRYNYINIKTKDGFIHYSLPQDLRAFYAIGCISTEWAMGKIDGTRAMQAYMTQANNYTPLSFVSTTIDREPDSNPVKNLAMSFVPSAAVPVAEIAVNEDFLGRRIHNQNQWNKYEPEWQRAGYRTPEWVINASKALSEAGGGTEHKRGVWFTEINPSNAWHVMDSYGGGFLDFAQKTYNLVEREFAGKEHELRDYPMVSKFYVESGQDYSKQRVVNDRYRMYREDYETIDNELNGYLKDKSNALGKLSVRAKEEGLPESVVNKERAEIEKTYEDNVKRVKESPNYWIYESFVPYEKGYNKLNSNLGQARKYGSEQTEKELSGEMYNVRKKLVDEIDAKRERPIDRVRQWLGN